MQLSDAEWIVMQTLWEEAPATARQLHRRMAGDPPWAYTTLKTMLTRLAEKQAVEVTKQGNVSLYRPLVTRNRARRSALRRLVDRAFGGTWSGLVGHLVAEERLTARDRARLKEMLRELDEQA